MKPKLKEYKITPTKWIVFSFDGIKIDAVFTDIKTVYTAEIKPTLANETAEMMFKRIDKSFAFRTAKVIGKMKRFIN